MRCARRPAGARTPASPTSAGSRRPDARTGRARARGFALLLPVVALLLGAIGQFAPAPAEAQTVTLVSNTGQSHASSVNLGLFNTAQGFVTGTNSSGYTLNSIGAVFAGSNFSGLTGELWSATSAGLPDSKLADLTAPASLSAGTITFTAPSNTTLTASTTYYVVFKGASVNWSNTNSNNEDSGAAAGWSILDSGRILVGSSWNLITARNAMRIRVSGSAKQASTANANLSALTAATHTSATGTFTSLTLTPSTFSATTTSYTATVLNARTHLKLTPTVAATGATVKVGKQGTTLATVTSGSASAAIALSVGSNAITVEVTAADNTTKKTYTVTVRRLASGQVWSATLTPVAFTIGSGGFGCATKSECDAQLSNNRFTFGGTNYHFTVFQDIDSPAPLLVHFSADTTAALRALKLCVGSAEFVIADISSTLRILSSSTDPGFSAGTPVSLSIGTSCAQQTTTPTQSTDATLSGLTATQATSASGPFSALSIGNFASGTTSYAASVGNSITHVKLTPAVNDSDATVTVAGTTVASGSASGAIALSVGANAITVEVTAEDGTTTQTYTVTVTRASAQTQTPAPVVPTGDLARSNAHNERTLLTATLTVDAAGTLRGCDENSATLANCSAALTTSSFTHEGTANTIAELSSNTLVGTLDVKLGTGIAAASWRRLTLYLDGESHPLANERPVGTTQRTFLNYPPSTWSPGQRVQVRLTARPWTGVVLESSGFLPSSETGWNDLIVPESGSATFGVKLSQAPTANVTVSLVKTGLQGQEGQHGDANAATVSPTTLTFTSTNYSEAQTVTVTGVADDDGDHEHLMILPLVSSTDADYASADGSEGVFVTVSDDGGAVQVGVQPAAGREAGNGQTSHVPVTVWLSRATTESVSVNYSTADGTATAGSDYTGIFFREIRIAPGETRKTVNVPILDDNVEDSGEFFWFELSAAAGATLAPGYDRARIEIANDEAHLDGLSVEGAPGAGGPWTKLDLGAFAAETTAYAVTVPHGTTHARLAPVTADEDLTLRAGSGTELTRVRSGESGPAVALAVGANVLVVKTTAATGVEKTYAVTVTRQAAAQQPEAQQQQEQQPAAPLTAAFANVPSEHDGTAFTFDLALSEAPGAGNVPVAASFKVAPGTASVSGSGTRYTVTVTPKAANAWKDVTITLAGGRACGEAGAVCTADGRSVSNTSSVTVGGPVRIRVANAKAREGKDASLDFAVTLNRAASHAVSVDYATEDGTAAAGADYTATSGTLVFAVGETAKTVSVPLLDDAIDEGKETMRLLLSNPQGAYLRGIHSKAKGVIRNDDPLQAMWLARFGRMVASDAVASVTARLETPRDAGSHVTFAGQRMNFGEAEGGGGAALATVLTGLAQTFGAPSAPAPDDDDPFVRHDLTNPWNDSATAAGARRVTGRELLLGTSFRAVLGQGAGSQWTSWGQGASVSRFSAAVPGLGLTGEAATGSMGMDYERGRLLMGFAMTHSVGEGTASDAGWRYALGSTATMAMPYARLALSDRVSVWGLAGTGSGRLSLDLDGAAPQHYRTDLAMTLAATGVRGDLLTPAEPGGFALALKADAFWVRTESDRVTGTEFGNLAAAWGESSRVRAVLDGSRTFSFASGAALTPKLELGVRHDAGDAETGTGLELGAGLGYADPSRGLDMALKVHGLAVHAEDGYDEWGVSGQLRLVPGGAGRGLLMSLTPSWGVDPAGSERLWALPASSGLAANGGAEPSSRFDAEVGYGMALLGDRFTGTPNVGFGMSDTAREYRMGWRLTSAVLGDPGFEVNLDATRREPANDNGETEHGVMLRSLIKW